MTKEMYEDLLERNKLQISELNTLTEEQDRHIGELSYSEKEEKAHNAITYIIARYLRVKDFAITNSFTGYLFLRIKHELFYRRKVDKIVDFVDWDSNRGAQCTEKE